jgi:hypothetical protein
MQVHPNLQQQLERDVLWVMLNLVTSTHIYLSGENMISFHIGSSILYLYLEILTYNLCVMYCMIDTFHNKFWFLSHVQRIVRIQIQDPSCCWIRIQWIQDPSCSWIRIQAKKNVLLKNRPICLFNSLKRHSGLQPNRELFKRDISSFFSFSGDNLGLPDPDPDCQTVSGSRSKDLF